jgi:hypothetical protein
MNDHNNQNQDDTSTEFAQTQSGSGHPVSTQQTQSQMPAHQAQAPQSSYVDDYVPPATTQDDFNEEKPSDSDSSSEESIETQNIFIMLGVEEGDNDLKEKFLDQLQNVIWDDFLNNDVELLLTEDEMTEFKVHKDKVDSVQTSEQEGAKDELVDYLEKKIPDLEDIMLEKALDLKADLFAERISGMKDSLADKPDQLAEVSKAESKMFEDKWQSAAVILNGVKE